MADVCEHGQLRRQCLVCERDEDIQRLVRALDGYMVACVCYHDNQWDLANIRKYAEAKAYAEEVLSDFREAKGS